MSWASGEDDNFSMAVENGTSHNSSRNGTDLALGDEVSFASELPAVDDEQVEMDQDDGLQQILQTQEVQQDNLNINGSVISETINDFCARHSREELEFLVRQVGYLKISDCYFSERSSTLCMVIEVDEK